MAAQLELPRSGNDAHVAFDLFSPAPFVAFAELWQKNCVISMESIRLGCSALRRGQAARQLGTSAAVATAAALLGRHPSARLGCGGARGCSNAAAPIAPADMPQLVFQGPKAGILRVLKACSVANLCLCALSSPAAVLLSTTGTPTTRLLMMGTVVAFSVSTTAMLHVATKPYVVSIRSVSPSRLEIATVGFLGRPRAREYALASLGPASSSMLFANLAAGGHPLYVDPLGEVRDERLMEPVRAAMRAPEQS